MKRIAALLLLLCLALTLGGCTPKVSRVEAGAIAINFRREAQRAGYSVSTWNSELGTDAAWIARKDGLEIILLVYPESRQAADLFALARESLLEEKGEGATTRSTSSADHERFRLSAGDEYAQLSRAFNTVLVTRVPPAYADEIKALYKTLKY